MLCPICKTELVKDGQAKMETLNEHITCSEVSLKDKYICPKKYCIAHHDMFWNEYGERYSIHKRTFLDGYAFIDNNDAPFGSFQRRINAEIREDEEYDLFKGKHIIIRRKYNYNADDNGNILSRKGYFKIIKDGTYYTSGIHMLIYSIKHFHKSLQWKKPKYEEKLPEWKKKDWWRRWAWKYKCIYLKYFYKK